MRLQPHFTIHFDNRPYHQSGDAARCASVLENGITIGEFVARAILSGGTVDEVCAKWYVSTWIRKGLIHLEADGVVLRQVTRREAIEFVATPLDQILTSYTFGAELECIVPRGLVRSDVARIVTSSGVQCINETYNHETRSHWKVVPDGSLRGSNGVEVVSPILAGDEGLRQVGVVCKALSEMNARITKRCGFHVHVGAAGKQLPWFKKLVALYAANEDAIDTILPASRRGNSYCVTVKHSVDRVNDSDTLRTAIHSMGGRFRKVNLEAFLRHGTVEFRQHSGTVEAEKAINWIKFCLRMCSAAERDGPVPTASNLSDLLSLLSVTEEERTYFNGRAARFASNERAVS